MTEIAWALARRGWILRTGGAPGADQAFEHGVTVEQIEVYLPWPRFEGHAGRAVKLMRPTPAAYEVASRFHPEWPILTPGAQKLHARNVHQVLGHDLRTHSRFVICWTPDGSLDGSGGTSGGTGQALRIAKAHGVTVFNLAHPEHAERLAQFMLVERRVRD